MNYVIMDLEWNGGYSARTHGYFNEIMEIGAVRLDEQLHPAGEFHVVIRPALVRELSKLVREMTGITEEELERGTTFRKAMAQMSRFAGEEAVIMTWSNTDLLMLEENLRYYFGGREEIPFMGYYADVQAYCQQRLTEGETQQLGLEAACRLADIDDEGADHHRALDDSRLTARLLTKLYAEEDFRPYILPADREFYSRLNYKTSFISDIESPLIDREALRFDCEDCRTDLIREKDWRYRSRGFYAPFVCPSCGKKYNARVQFKQKYDGVIVKRRLTLRLSKPEGEEEAMQNDTGGENYGESEEKIGFSG